MVGGVGLWMWLVAGVGEARADSCRADGALVCTSTFVAEVLDPDVFFQEADSDPPVVCIAEGGANLAFYFSELSDDIVFCTHEDASETQPVGRITVADGRGHDLTLLDVEISGRANVDNPIISWTATGTEGETVSLRKVHGDRPVPQVSICLLYTSPSPRD